MTATTYERAIDLLEAELGDELVALSVDDGNCFGFNAAATSVWRALEQPRSFDDLKAILLAQFDVPAEQCAGELQSLLDDMIAKDLVRTRPAGSLPGEPLS